MLSHPRPRRLFDLACAEAEPADRHLKVCAHCRNEVASLRALLALSRAAAVVPEPRQGLEARLCASLRYTGTAPAGNGWFPRLGLGLALATVLAVVALWMRPRTSPAPRPQNPAVTSVRARIVRATAANQLERAEMLLVTLAHAPSPRNPTLVDLSLEQGWARELVDTNRLVRQSAAWNGQAEVAQLLGDLDPVLLQIAHAPATVSHAQWQMLQDRISASGLLFRVRIAGQNLSRGDSSSENGTL